MIHIDAVRKSFAGKPVLDSISLTFKPGERAALVGHNGSGKTTLMRCLLGLYQCEGEVKIAGASPREDRARVLAEVAFVPQAAPALRMSVGAFITMTAELCGCTEAAIEKCAAELGLKTEDISNKPFRLLSGGMKQKLLIAAAVARRPKVLLMDEPAANLDPAARAQFFQLLAKLPPETIMLLSSHRVDELAGIVTRLIELDGGRVVLDDLVATGAHDTLDRRMVCKLQLNSPNATVAAGLAEWGFTEIAPQVWQGSVAAADRFRLLATLTRWSGVIDSLHWEADA